MIRTSVALIALSLLAACGGGGGGGGSSANSLVEGLDPSTVPDPGADPDYIAFANTGASGTTTLGYLSLTAGGARNGGNAGTLDHDGGQGGVISGGLLAGQVNSAQTSIDLNSGGTADVSNPAGTDYARFFATEGTSADRFGVFGQVTQAADLPTDSYSLYTGRASVDAANDNGTYALNGTASVLVDWDDNHATTRLDSLSGQLNGITTVTNAGQVDIVEAPLSGSNFTGGTATVTGFDDYTGGISHAGSLFGPDAAEVGGVASVSTGDFQMRAIYGGSR